MKNLISKRALAIILAIMMLLPTLSLFSINASAASWLGGFDKGTNAWKSWSQNQSTVYSQGEYKVGGWGCWVVADARLLCDTGIKSSSNFTPDDLYRWYLNNGGFTGDQISKKWTWGAGYMHPVQYAKSACGNTKLKYKGQYSTDANTIVNLCRQGYYIIANVGFHYVYIDREATVKNNSVYIYDSYGCYKFNENGNIIGYCKSFPSNPRKSTYTIKEIYVYEYTGKTSTQIDYKVTNKEATSISNDTAVIGFSVSPNASASDWGFYISTVQSQVDNKTAAKKTVTRNSGTTCYVDTYTGALQPNTIYYYRTWAVVGGKEICATSTSSFRTTNNKPGTPTLTVDKNSVDIGIGSAPTINWKSGKDASSYDAKTYTAVLYDSNNNKVQEKTGISKNATSYTFDPINSVGTYRAFIYAVNRAGSTQGTPVGTITVHPDVTVSFVDADPTSFVDWQEGDSTEAQILHTETYHYGESANLPANPSHEGYTFDGWDGYSGKLTEDVTLTAKYKINEYTVNFVDEKGATLSTQKVNYRSAATAPDYEVTEPGYVFADWDKDFSCVTSDMTVRAVKDWYNNNYSVYTSVTSAVRDDSNNGYDISISVVNNASSVTLGRAVIALKTSEDKLLTTTESSAFSIKAGQTKTLDVFVPYENSAKYVYVYIVNDYKRMTPISQAASAEISSGLAWTSWSTEIPAEGTYDSLEVRTEYRYKTRATTTSYATSMSGWTQDGYELKQSASDTIDYVESWPSGFPRSHSLYSSYNKTPVTSSESSTQKTTVTTSTKSYIYYHWCESSLSSTSPFNRLISDEYGYDSSNGRTYDTPHAFEVSSQITWNSSKNALYLSDASKCTKSYWWVGMKAGTSTPITVKRCTWTTYNKLYNYYQISDWSDWGTTQLSTYENVETRTTYRYVPKDTSIEDTDGIQRTISGTLDPTYAGQQLTLYIYKVDEASDYSNEYLGQTVVGNDGSYSFSFKLREEPSIKSGDFTVALGLEGASSLMYLDPIEAPRKSYTVIYRDWDGTLLSTQTVYEGDDAVLPDESLYGNREGYHFTHWTATNTNVKDNLEIFAEYEINEYTVVFVDWEARNVQIEKFEYGAVLVAPAFESTDPGVDVVWDKIADGVTTVTQDMVICTEYTPKTYDVVFRDFDGNIISEQNVTYGYAADVPELDADEDRVFLDWMFTEDGEDLNGYIVTSKIDVCPKYVFNETCEGVYASVESGEYTEAQTVTLSCETENAVIYYTLDGSDPTGDGALTYSEPITVRDYAMLKCYAVAMGYNDSGINTYYYIINPTQTVSDYLTYDQLPDYVLANPDDYNVEFYEGYQFKNTVTADTLADYEAYIADGWTASSVDYADWSEWQDDEIAYDDSRINFEIETRNYEYEETEPSWCYNRWVYTDDGVTKYSATEVEGFTGTWEYSEVAKTNAYTLKIGDGGATYFLAPDGGIWYNRTSGTLTHTKSKPQYRSRYAIAMFYKWETEAYIAIPDGDTREYRNVNLFTYELIRHHFVTVAPVGVTVSFAGSAPIIIADGATLSADIYPELYGYTPYKLYKDAELTQEWNLATDTVTEDTTLYAAYTPVKFNVTFAYADGTEIETQQVDYLEAADAPATVELPDGYMFLGWDSDNYTCVTEDMVIKARYILESEYATVNISEEEISLLAGTKTTLMAETSVSGKDVVWSSSDETVAIVDDGVVTALSAGTTTITATVSDSGESDTCTVVVLGNTSIQICLTSTSALSYDTLGYLRGVRADGNAVSDNKTEFANPASKLYFYNIADDPLADDGLIGTGTTVKLIIDGEELDSKVFVVTGDMTGDGIINNRDIAMMNRYLVNRANPADYQILAIDVNGDGTVNNRDAAMLARYLVGKESI